MPLRTLAALIALTLTLALAAPQQADAQETEIQGTITAQLDALKTDDFGQAFTFASPTIRRIFRTPENFGRMVSQGYPMVWRPAEVQYLELREEAGALVQKVMITDMEGGLHILDYSMIETGDGWKINGVRLLSSGAVAA